MSIDDVLRTIAYCVIIPGATYTGIRVWNAHVMPEHLRRPVAVFLFLQSAIYTLFMVGLILVRLWHPSPALLWINTVFVFSQAIIVIIVVLRLSRLRRAIVSVAFMLAALLLGGWNKP